MPFKSKAQMRYCFYKNDPKWNCQKYYDETPNPQHIKIGGRGGLYEMKVSKNGKLYKKYIKQ
jgi:hypothetical protein